MRATLALLMVLLAATALADTGQGGVSAEVAAENAAPGPEIFRIAIVNSAGGEIAVSRDEGATWLCIGTVRVPALGVNPAGYTASKWAEDSAVAATAVNAVHLKVANNPETGRGIVISLVPAGEAVGAAEGRPGSTIGTDIAAGSGIFGGGFAPAVNSPLGIERDGEIEALPADYVPADGDQLVIRVLEAPTALVALTFDNSFGGLIRAIEAGGGERVIGMVLRPVSGIGRFEGTFSAAPGRIRANHAGVIDISTSPLSMIGGFQIVPSGHADSPEVSYIRTGTAWMVVGPVTATEPTWEGVAPLFAGYLHPSYRPDDLQHDDWMRRLLSRSQVLVQYDNGDWELMPRIAIDPEATPEMDSQDRGRNGLWRIAGSLRPAVPAPAVASTALRGVTAIRIDLPRAQFWPESGAP
jgi:hypothetical protein